MPDQASPSLQRPGFALAALPDEHVDSVLARYHRLSACPTPEVAISELGLPQGPLKSQDIFNGPARTALPALAALLDTPVRTLAEQHTLWPLYRSAMRPEAANAWMACWEAGTSPGHRIAEPLNDRMLHHDRRWRYCPECQREDRTRFGVSYWHTSHQLPGLGSCPHHRSRLVAACPTCGASRLNLRGLELPSPCDCNANSGPPANPHWDEWLQGRFAKLRSGRPDALNDTLGEIRDGLDLPTRLTGKHQDRLEQLLVAVENVVGRRLLGEIFEWYSTPGAQFRGRRQPNLIRATLAETTRWRVRHPLYYLVLLYAIDLGVGQSSARDCGDELGTFAQGRP